MNRNNISALKNLEVNVDPIVWKSIETELDRKRKRRILYIFLILSLAVSSVIFKINHHSENELVKINSVNEGSGSKMGNAYLSQSENELSSIKSEHSNSINKIKNEEKTKSKIDREIESSSMVSVVGMKKSKSSSNPNSVLAMDNDSRVYLNDELIYLEPFVYAPDEISSSELLLTRNQQVEIKSKHFNRFSFSLSAGISHSDFKEVDDELSESSFQFSSIDHGYFSAKVNYDLSPRWAFSIGVSTLKIEQESIGSNTLYFPPNTIHPENYNLSATFGSLTGDATLLNQIILGHDTSFNLTFAGSSVDTTITTEMKINEQFSFVHFPVQVYYKFTGNKIIPFVSALFSTGYLTSNSILINDIKLPFNYNEKLSKLMLSAGLSAGASVRLFGRWNVFTEVQYEKHLTSVLSDRVWKPLIFKIGAGINYRF